MKKNVNENEKNVNKEVIVTDRVDSVDTVSDHRMAGRVIAGEKYLAFNPFVGTPDSKCWLVSQKVGGVWRRLAVVDDKGVVRDMLLTADAARILVGV